jgi:hypothetical protein
MNTAPVSFAGAGADGSTLKATAPTPESPINNEQLKNRRPTMVAKDATGLYVDRAFSYQFELLTDTGALVASATQTSEGGTTRWAYPEDLARDTPYRWRVRATLEGAVGPWSATGRFLTARENRADNPPPGSRLPRPNWGAAIVAEVAADRPDLLADSCQEDGGTWEFMDAVVDALREVDTRWGYNWKRGVVGDPSKDVVDYNWGSEPDEGTTQVYLFDIISGHCGPNPGPGWNDVTDTTYGSGTTGMWTGRGRF